MHLLISKQGESMTEFNIDDNISIDCWTYETRYSWGHKATLYISGYPVKEFKIVYYNRTWEAYQFQSMLYHIADRALKAKLITEEQAKAIRTHAGTR